MNRDKWLQLVREQLPEKRYAHTVRVAETAVRLAERYGADREKADLAGILHDYAKYWSSEQMKRLMEEDAEARDVLAYGRNLWHAHAGALAVEADLGVRDPDILNAIRYHTSGRAGMSLLEKVIWLADYIEPGRRFPGVDTVRELAEKRLEDAMVQALAQTIQFLVQKRRMVYPMTIEAYNDVISQTEEGD